MKIGFDAKRAFNNGRGLGNYSRETLRILAALAPENHYFLFTPKVSADIAFTPPQASTLVTPNHGVNPSWWRTFRITKEAERLHLDLYHGLSHELPVGIEKLPIGTVVTMHDLLFIKHPELFPTLDRIGYRSKYLRSCRVADRIIAVSEQTKRDLLELTDVDPRKVEVVYQGCRPEFRATASEEQKRNLREKHHLPESYLLNVGAIEPRKNQLLILKALASGKIDMPLVIAGQQTNYLKELQQYIICNGLQGRVMLLPDFPQEELPLLYQNATLFVFPSVYEGFGIPLVEALESGLPIIAATGSCLEETGGPDSLYVDPHDADALADAIMHVLDDSAKRQTMVAKGHEYAKRFSDQAIAEHLIRIYKETLP